ncbi:Stealth CR1 domain-containing protein [bacterium]|nr:Stealth CR1 domain-containing protein [bacterium]
MQNPKISIIVPVYNVEKYLQKCLDSLVNQTLKDIEIICINDGSTDNSLEILQEYAKKDKRIQIISKKNEGQGVARNIGIEHAQGEYLGFVDPDDWVELEMYEQMYNQAKNLNSEIVICDYKKHQEGTNKNWTPITFEYAKSATQTIKLDVPCNKNIEKNLLMESLFVSPCYSWNKLVKRNLILENDIRFSNIKCYEDVIFILKSFIYSNNFSYVNKSFYHYRIRKNSTVRTYENRYKDFIYITEEIKTFLKNQKLLHTMKKNLEYFFVMGTYWQFKSLKKFSSKFLLLKYIIPKLKTSTNIKLFLKIFSLYYSPIFSITNNNEYKIINIFGLKIKHNRFKTKFPIDLVYLWVDGNDVEWQKEKQKWQEKLGLNQDNKVLNACRFIDNEELKYSLRSVAKNLPWINHIYIVTNGQIPKWLDTNHPKITIVNHKEIMPADALPTFNSEAIETCIHNIFNLSECFLLSCDDFFAYKMIPPTYFFTTNGKPINRFVKHHLTKIQIDECLYFANNVYSEQLIKKKYNKLFNCELPHTITPYRISDYKNTYENFRNEFVRTCYSKFRTSNCTQRIMINLYSYIISKCPARFIKIHSKKRILENLYLTLKHPIKMDREINRHSKKLKLFCINDTENTKQEDRELLKSYLEFLFPQKQSWELQQT